MRRCGLARAVGVQSHFDRYFGLCVIVCGSPIFPARVLLIDGGHPIIHACGGIDFAGCRSAGHSFGRKTTSAYNSKLFYVVDVAWLDFEDLLVPILRGPNTRVHVSPFVMGNANHVGRRSLSIVLVSPSLCNRALGVRVNARGKHGDHERDSLSHRASELRTRCCCQL